MIAKTPIKQDISPITFIRLIFSLKKNTRNQNYKYWG